MLSRQIDNGAGYEDGATRLQRKESQLGPGRANVNLHDLEELVSDPTGLARRMSVDRTSMESSSEIMNHEDMPILPGKGMQTLKRSTRTTYRKHGSLKKPGGRRQLNKTDEIGEPVLGGAPQLPDVPQLPDLAEYADMHFGLTRSNTDPTMSSKYNSTVDNFSRPGRRQGSTSPVGRAPSRSATFDESMSEPSQFSYLQPQRDEPLQSRYSNGRSNQYAPQIPQIVETPPIDLRQQTYDPQAVPKTSPERHPEHQPPPSRVPPSRPTPPQPQQPRPQSLPQRLGGASANQRPANITLNDIASHQNQYSQNDGRTDSLSLIPTYPEDNTTPPSKKSDKKQKNKDDSGSRKTSWNNWFSSSGSGEEKERERREREEKEHVKKSGKSRLQKSSGSDKQRYDDNARLDLLQSSIDGKGGRESTVFDRTAIQVDEDTQSNKKRPSTSEGKKDGFLSTLFSSSKRRSDREDKSSKKSAAGALSGRGLSPDPPHTFKLLRPDVDYNWTRFSILEERAIYRMAHIKLANPRRELHSQVLLSNFMYSYLAKVQQMHPQIQIPASAAQKQQQAKQRQEEERKQREIQQQQQREQQQQRDPQRVAGGANAGGEEGYGGYQRYHTQDVRLVHKIARDMC